MSESNMEALLEKMMEQNAAANQLLADVAKQRDEAKKWEKILPWIICGVVALCFTIVMCVSFWFFSQYEFFSEETTITLDAGEGDGNNVYQEGESAQYHESPKES